MFGDDFLDSLIKMIAIHHQNRTAPKAKNLDVRANANDLESFASSEAGMGLFHLHFIV